MKAAMRLDPSQVSNKLRLKTVGSIQVAKAVLIQAGLKNYDVMCIGSPGGRAGDARAASSRITEFGSGGGGGGAVRVKGLIADLPDIITLTLGAAGTVGGDAGDNVSAGNGGDGGNATFAGTVIGYGGKGATGGKAHFNLTTGVGSSTVSTGGAGGSNSLGLGAGGAGGHGRDYDQSNNIVGATDGTFVESGGAGFGGGKGGGGGAGAGWIGGFNPPWQTMGDAAPGADGSTGGDGTKAGPGGLRNVNNGGTGGGANAKPILGVDEYYGGPGQLGVVIVNFT